MKKMQHCANCGAELGVYEKYYRDIESCGKLECDRQIRRDQQAAREEAHENLDRDLGY